MHGDIMESFCGFWGRSSTKRGVPRRELHVQARSSHSLAGQLLTMTSNRLPKPAEKPPSGSLAQWLFPHDPSARLQGREALAATAAVLPRAAPNARARVQPSQEGQQGCRARYFFFWRNVDHDQACQGIPRSPTSWAPSYKSEYRVYLNVIPPCEPLFNSSCLLLCFFAAPRISENPACTLAP